jgi:two-component system, OmpR family, sensor kinase
VTAGRPRRALRTRLLVLNVAAVAVALAILTTVFNLVLGYELDRSADDVLRARAAAQVGALSVEDGRIELPQDPPRGGPQARAWVFEGEALIQEPSVGEELTRAARSLVDGATAQVDVEEEDVRLLALPVVDRGRRVGTVVASVSIEPYERVQRIALVASIALAVLVLGGVAAVSALMLRAALRPVARMTADAAAWSERDLDKRFAAGPPTDEITQLASTLDGLLDRIAAGMRRERSLTAEVSHELRTPLARIRAEADLALRRERGPEDYRAALESVREGADRLASVMDMLLAAARQESGSARGTADAYRAAVSAAAACASPGRGRVRISVAPPPARVRAGVDEELLARILQPLVENAARFAREEVLLELATEPGSAVITVGDDGPGVDPADVERIFDPGVRGAGGDGDQHGAGLGLALSRRLARAAGGDVDARPGPGGRFVVRVPAA